MKKFVTEYLGWKAIAIAAVMAAITIMVLAPFKFYQERLVTYIDDFSDIETEGYEVEGNTFKTLTKEPKIYLPIKERYTRVDIAFEPNGFKYKGKSEGVGAFLDYAETETILDGFSKTSAWADKSSSSVSLSLPSGQYGQVKSYLQIGSKKDYSFKVNSIAVYTRDIIISFRMIAYFGLFCIMYLLLHYVIYFYGTRKLSDGVLIGIVLYTMAFWILIVVSHGDMYNTFFVSDLGDTFMDHFNSIVKASGEKPYGGTNPSNYPPIVLLFYQVCGKVFQTTTNMENGYGLREISMGLMSFLLLFLVLLILTNELISKISGERNKWLTFALLTSGPMLFAIERGNCVLISFVLTLFFVVSYNNDNKVLRELAYVALALAFCFKIYPAVFGALLLYDRKFFAAARTAIYGLVLFFVPFICFGGGSACKGFVAGILKTAGFTYGYGNNYSLYNLISFIMTSCGITSYELLYRVVLILVAVSMLAVMFLDKEIENRILAMTLCLLLIPKASYLYVGIFVWIPFAVFIKNVKTKKLNELTVREWVHLAFYMILLVPTVSPYIQKIAVGKMLWISYGQALMFISCFVMVCVLLVQLIQNWKVTKLTKCQ